MSVDFTYKNGEDVQNFITDSFKHKIIIKSFPYNTLGAYWPFECTIIGIGDELYNALTLNDQDLKDLYVSYYNNIKLQNDKIIYNMPKDITVDDIASIIIVQLNINCCEYYER
jgi:hypothetical protein